MPPDIEHRYYGNVYWLPDRSWKGFLRRRNRSFGFAAIVTYDLGSENFLRFVFGVISGI